MNGARRYTWPEFRAAVEAAGLTARICGSGVWQVRGAFVVNYYPETKKGPVLHVQTTKGSTPAGSVQDVIRAAQVGAEGNGRCKRTADRAYIRRVKVALLKKDPRCRYCKCDLAWLTATVDHLIPLARGGTNGRDNLVLACRDCNKKKSHNMPTKRGWKGKAKA